MKLFKSVILSSLLLLNLEAKNKELSTSEIASIENLNLFEKAKVKITKAYDIGSLYVLDVLVKGSKDEVFLTKDKKYLISGNVIDTSNGSELKIPLNLSILKDKEAFIYGEGKDEYILFTDPECKYCKKFESYLPQIKDKVKIKVFFFPLDFHKNARDLSLYIMSQKTNAQKVSAMFEFKLGDDLSKVKNKKYSKDEEEKLKKNLEEHLTLANSLRIQGTPALFDENGNNIIWINLLEKYDIKLK